MNDKKVDESKPHTHDEKTDTKGVSPSEVSVDVIKSTISPTAIGFVDLIFFILKFPFILQSKTSPFSVLTV